MATVRASAALAVICMTMPSVARAQPVQDVRGRVTVAMYVDDLDTTVWSPHTSVGAVLPWELGLDLTWGADVITSASVDVITAASTSVEETRNEVGVRLRRDDVASGVDVTAGYEYSFENDGHSHIMQVGVARGFDQDNTELAVRYSVSLNRMGVGGTPSSTWLAMTAHGADVTLTRVINRRTLAAVNYSVYYLDGFQASLYRRVPILPAGDLRGATWVEERTPDTRLRHAVTVSGRRAIARRVVGAAQYRFYLDDWGISAHTVRLDQAVELSKSLAARLSQRLSVQGGADFFAPIYSQEMTYHTRDRRLSPHLNGSLAGTLLWELGSVASLGKLEAYVSVSGLAWQYDEFTAPVVTFTGDAQLAPLGWVMGAVSQIGVEVRR